MIHSASTHGNRVNHLSVQERVFVAHQKVRNKRGTFEQHYRCVPRCGWDFKDYRRLKTLTCRQKPGQVLLRACDLFKLKLS